MNRFGILLVIGLLILAAPAFSQPLIDDYNVAIGPGGGIIQGGGSGYNNGHWYVYPSGWINEWFYDHPLDLDRGKIMHIEFDWIGYQQGVPTDITVAINWSTPEWSALGFGDTQPPIPGFDEQLYIQRHTMLHYVGNASELQHFAYDFIIWAYNPEWVSIDVMGANFRIAGIIIHECALGTENQSWGAIKGMFR